MTEYDYYKKKIIHDLDVFLKNQNDAEDETKEEELSGFIFRLVEIEAKELGYGCEKVSIKGISEEDIKFQNDKMIRLVFCDSPQPFSGLLRAKLGKSDFFMLFDRIDSSSIDNKLALVLEVVSHEMQHLRQHLMTRTNVSSPNNLYFAIEYASRYKDPENEGTNDKYEKHHDTFPTEEDAYHQSKIALGKIGNIPNIKTYFPEGELSIERTEYIMQRFEEQIKNEEIRQEVFAEFPVLLKAYNKNGTRKPPKLLMRQMLDEIGIIERTRGLSKEEKKILISDCKAMYFELLYRHDLWQTNISEIQQCMAMYYAKYQSDLLYDLRQYFYKKASSEKDKLMLLGVDRDEQETRQDVYRGKAGQIEKIDNSIYNYTKEEIIRRLSKKYVRMGRLKDLKRKIASIFQKNKIEERNK